MEVIFLWILICEWTIWAIYLLDLLAHTLDFSLEYSYQKTIRTNIRIYSYQNNDTNEYPNIFASKKWYERISEYIRIKKTIRMNIRIYSHQKNDTNMIRTNIRTGKYSNIFEYPNIRHTLAHIYAGPWF